MKSGAEAPDEPDATLRSGPGMELAAMKSGAEAPDEVDGTKSQTATTATCRNEVGGRSPR